MKNLLIAYTIALVLAVMTLVGCGADNVTIRTVPCTKTDGTIGVQYTDGSCR